MICINVNIPDEICKIDDELKAIYHSSDSICIWVFKSRSDRNKFMDETAGMLKKDREDYYISNFEQCNMRFFILRIKLESVKYNNKKTPTKVEVKMWARRDSNP